MHTTFASDNYSTVHPEVMAQLTASNKGHQSSYGEDESTAEARALFEKHFGAGTQVCFVTTGTAANVLSMKILLSRPYEAIILPESGHMFMDEVGAPQSTLGAQLFTVPTTDGKLQPEQLEAFWVALADHDYHSSLPKVVSIAQSTEYGTIYTPEEVRAIADWCHKHDMYLHMDGCRLPNAAVALGQKNLRVLTRDAGVDVLSFGGAKNGLMNAEAVVIFNAPESSLPRMQKQLLQLSSKMRYVSAQFIPYLQDDLWHESALKANTVAALLAAGLKEFKGVTFTQKIQTNQLFLTMPPAMKQALHAKGHHFYDWDATTHEIRLVGSWDNTEADVTQFITDAQAAA